MGFTRSAVLNDTFFCRITIASGIQLKPITKPASLGTVRVYYETIKNIISPTRWGVEEVVDEITGLAFHAGGGVRVEFAMRSFNYRGGTGLIFFVGVVAELT